MKLTCDAYLKINRRQKTHADSGKLISHSLRANFLDPSTIDSYVYKIKILIQRFKEYMMKMKIVLENSYIKMLKIMYHDRYYHMKHLSKK